MAKGEDGPVRQRHGMGEGDGPMRGGNFGVGALPGTRSIPGKDHDTARMLDDRERGCGPSVHMGSHKMSAAAAPDHGPHGHSSAMHDHMPEGKRPHHIRGGKAGE